MQKFWVSYAIVDARNGGQTGTGAIDVKMDHAPGDFEDVLRLADEMTEVLLSRGQLATGQHVSVLAWSRMGD